MRAKFYVYSKTEFSGNESVQVVLQAVTRTSPENESFWKWTPSGKLEMSIKPEAAAFFIIGKEYYLDFTRVAEETQS